MSREMERTGELLDRLQRDFGNDGEFSRDLDNLNSNYGRHYNTGVLLDEASAEFFKETVLESMSQLEMKLIQKLNELELEQKLYEARAAEVPSEYRKAVERYFETLSKSHRNK